MVEPTPRRDVVVTALAAVSAFGHGVAPLHAAALAGRPGFALVQRFDVSRRRVQVAATLPGAPDLAGELASAVRQVVWDLDRPDRSRVPLLLAGHAHPELTRASDDPPSLAALAAALAAAAGLGGPTRAYTSACVASSSAVADAAAMISLGRAERVVVAAGYLVEPDQFALFDAGRALAADGRVRPFSARRRGLLLGDGVAALLLESAGAAAARGARVQARLVGWGRAGDAYHVCQPRPDGAGLARAIGLALRRASLEPEAIDYVNAHGSGTAASDAAEAAALDQAMGAHAHRVPISSTKAIHGQALEASGLLELVITIASVRDGGLPVNAGYLAPDPDCRLNVVLTAQPRQRLRYALSLNSAFGGANTAVVLGAPC